MTGPVNPVARVGGRFRLLVVADNAVLAIHSLPEAGSVTIGRGEDNLIQIDDESISRRHAILHVGPVMTIEDLGSSNGTKFRDLTIEPHAPHELGVNELVTLGSLTVIIQGRFTPPQTSRIATHDYFQARLEEECSRAERTGAQFAVLGIRVSGVASESAVVEALMMTLRQSDVLAKQGERAYELLLIDSPRDQAELVAQRLLGCLEAVNAKATHVVVGYPDDSRSAYELMTRIVGGGDETAAGDDLIIAEQSMRDLYALISRIARSDLPVLILGETGVGKEKMSRAVHQYSPRASHPFLAINCAALNDALLESELFGHERGSFTGANTVKTGLLEAATGGTVFLDEIGDMSLAIQAKLLRVIEDGEVRKVGAIKSTKIHVRFVAATNTDLETATEQGRFREDLYFRLSAATLVIPPLRERPNEIELLASRFANRASMRASGSAKALTPAALAMLKRYSWPGNIRELRNVIERAVLLCGESSIALEHLPAEKMRGTFVRAPTNNTGTDAGTPEEDRAAPDRAPPDLGDERARILGALEKAGGNQSKAAALLGMSRRTLINRLEEYKLPRPRKGRSTRA
ncbi:MAG: sigma 54-interacting transcriptional regulator [Deltaproteobacteria bacterium]|nr:sigma 54-interacting transcriptional regulator [Deltaproteobacteria bacterium]